MSWIQTYTKRKFPVLNPQLEDFDIKDIAHALSMQCRFAGHVKEFYSVAQHCLEVSMLLPIEYQLEGLLHDGSEAYYMDIPRPLKYTKYFDGYRELEANAQRLIYMRFGVPVHEESTKEVKIADNTTQVLEARKYLGACIDDWDKDMCPGLSKFSQLYYNVSLAPIQAEKLFIERFLEVSYLTREYLNSAN